MALLWQYNAMHQSKINIKHIGETMQDMHILQPWLEAEVLKHSVLRGAPEGNLQNLHIVYCI